MKKDIAELFERTQTPEMNYREIDADRRASEAIGRWPLLVLTARLLEHSNESKPRASDAAELFRSHH